MTQPDSAPAARRHWLNLRGIGWVLMLSGILMVGTLIYHVSVILAPKAGVGSGDGSHVASYGFDLSQTTVPINQIVAAGLRTDDLPALVKPATAPVANTPPNEPLAGTRKVENVIGVVVNGVARAYPLWLLEWHEIANDELGGEPIAVTYNPLSGVAAVFSRRVGDEVLEFGVSGLLYDSNLLMYDRRADRAKESLWSQLRFAAVAGPAAGRKLRVLPMVISHYRDWRERFPESTVVLPRPERKSFYRRQAYLRYLADDELAFPVDPQPQSGRALKSRLVAERGPDGWSLRFGSTEFATVVDTPALAQSATPRVYAFWFAWYALHNGEDWHELSHP